MSPPRVLPIYTKKPRRNLRGSDALGIDTEWQRPKALFTKARRRRWKRPLLWYYSIKKETATKVKITMPKQPPVLFISIVICRTAWF